MCYSQHSQAAADRLPAVVHCNNPCAHHTRRRRELSYAMAEGLLSSGCSQSAAGGGQWQLGTRQGQLRARHEQAKQERGAAEM